MGTNHLGHALLIKLLLPTLNRAAKLSPQRPRIVFTSSLLWTVHPSGGIDFSTLHTTQRIRWPIISFFGPWIRYGQSKLANLLYAAEMARQYPQFITTSVHPGLIATNISAGHSFLDRLLLIIARTLLGIGMVVEEGIKNQLWAATAPESSVVSGEFYEPVGKVGKSDKISKSTELAKKLWDWTEEELAAYAE
jgi:NAD(P)-dependent dehydrogenase (short-subunit alcohol dehydrogenase family)